MARCLCFIIQTFTRNCTSFYVSIFNFQDFSRRILINSAYSIINSNKKLLILSSNHISYYSKKYLHKIKNVSFLSVLIINKRLCYFLLVTFHAIKVIWIFCAFLSWEGLGNSKSSLMSLKKKEKPARTGHMTGQGFH